MAQDLLLGDVGGSGSRWARLSDDAVVWSADDLPGANPATGTVEALGRALRERSGEMGRPRSVVVYGAGCGSMEQKDRMHALLATEFKNAAISVMDDLLGAARALHGDGEGRVLILGTGMNAGHYDGRTIKTRIRSLGFVLGDEGSGADIGRCLFRDALRGEMPPHVQAALFGTKDLDLAATRSAIYGSVPMARVLAGPVRHLHRIREDPYVLDLLGERFGRLAFLLERELGRGTFRATGSVAWAFQDALQHALHDHGLGVDTVQRDPLEGLITYHRAHPTQAPH
ncbi:MAG: hypothetical protein H6594_01775 [Flavobacteriales bacterium]|nr:hypothetical protein [Flavobacteriales bacterium]